MTAETSALLSNTGFVVIGRNEGERLQASLRAITKLCPDSLIVYVDSGSTDNSVEFASSIGTEVVELNMEVPFTAARARNAGFHRLMEKQSDLKYVQFLDGDCQIIEGWIESALQALSNNDELAIVSGRRRERFPEQTIYNTLMDIEWNTPIGETKAVLGDMCVEVESFKNVNGFTENVIAAEDDDFCIKVRNTGKKVKRLDANMSWHDANLTKASQWFRRAKRCGHGYAQVNKIHGNGPDHYFKTELLRSVFWGALIPSSILVSVFFAPPITLLLIVVYILFVARNSLRLFKNGQSVKVALAYSCLIYTSKIYEFWGATEFWKNHFLSRKHQLIEYK